MSNVNHDIDRWAQNHVLGIDSPKPWVGNEGTSAET